MSGGCRQSRSRRPGKQRGLGSRWPGPDRVLRARALSTSDLPAPLRAARPCSVQLLGNPSFRPQPLAPCTPLCLHLLPLGPPSHLLRFWLARIPPC